MLKTVSIKLFLSIALMLIFIGGCKKNADEKLGKMDANREAVEYSPEKDLEIQKYNLQVKKEQTKQRFECDTISVMEYVLDNYPKGTYLLNFDKTFTYNIPKPAVIYFDNDKSYIFGVIAESRPGERLIEPKNIIGYDESYIDLDSTKLGTAFFYLVLFHCDGGKLNTVWKALIPSHGGFNNFSLHHWKFNGTPYVKVNFHYAQGVGHIDYNYFLVDGLTSSPQLLMTYKGINFQRTITNINNDKFPDYYEYIYYDSGNAIKAVDSVAFIWKQKDSLYVSSRNRKQTRRY